jgi:hypothetical protein
MYKNSEYNEKLLVDKKKSYYKKKPSEFLDMTLYEEVYKDPPCAHNLHQNMKALAFNEQDKENNIADEESVLFKVSQDLRQSIIDIKVFDKNNRDVDVKLDLLAIQNEILIRKCLYLENTCERFFSKISNIESDISFIYENKTKSIDNSKLVKDSIDSKINKNTKILYENFFNEDISLKEKSQQKKNILNKFVDLFKIKSLIQI